jgi:hypothetical protein
MANKKQKQSKKTDDIVEDLNDVAKIIFQKLLKIDFLDLFFK